MICLNPRRGISTLVGSIFFLVLLTSGLSISYLVIETQSDMIHAQQTIADSEIKKIQEKFYASASTDASNRLVVYVENQSPNPLEIDTLWIVNKTSSAQDAQKYELNYTDSILAPGYGGDVLQNKPLFMTPGSYDIKVVSSLGTIKAAAQPLNVGGANNLKAKLILNPPDVRLGENATALLYVTNVGNTKMLNVTSGPITVTPPSAVLESSPITQMKSDLLPAESTIISWKYRLMGAAGTNVTFSTFAQGVEDITLVSKQSNTDTNSILLRDNSEPGSIVSSDLFSRPEIFMVIPNPFGEASGSNKGVWGVNIINPTDQPIYVSKVVVSAQTAPATSSDTIFPSSCGVEIIPPTTNNWSCPTDNQLMWKNTATPQLVPPKSVFPFLVKVTPGTIGGSNPEPETVIVQTNVFTTLGQFGKSAYGTAIRSSSTSIPNVYLSKVVDSTNAADIISNKTGILPGSTQTFNVVLADMDAGGSSINANSRLIINIPKGWSNVNVIGNTGFTNPTYQSFPDGSSQLVGQLLNPLAGGGKTITFTATAPPITDTRMYVMYILADGFVGTSVVGPLAEIVLQVASP